jgi:thiamine monophosphate synthase
MAPAAFLIGRSVHARDEIVRVVEEGAVDNLLFGTVFETASKPDRVAVGVVGLTEAVRAAARLPVLAVGGITVESVGRLAGTGCSGFAAIGQFADGPEDRLAATVTAALGAWENPR